MSRFQFNIIGVLLALAIFVAAGAPASASPDLSSLKPVLGDVVESDNLGSKAHERLRFDSSPEISSRNESAELIFASIDAENAHTGAHERLEK